jgi:hypothetical protein
LEGEIPKDCPSETNAYKEKQEKKIISILANKMFTKFNFKLVVEYNNGRKVEI